MYNPNYCYIVCITSIISLHLFTGKVWNCRCSKIERAREDDRGENKNIEENKLPVAIHSGAIEPELASAAASSGEKVNENAHHYSNL
ncbi:MAG: hypothetical protein PVS3B3_03040 [Ktedonobacteraceae bacterium]